MPKRVTLDAMIPREDFAVEGDKFDVDLFPSLKITEIGKDQPIQKLLRKPDFQRETNHWTPEQLATFVESFLDNEVIPSLIFWKSSTYIFVIDGGHRLSALRAWMEDDYGAGPASQVFYNGEVSEEQKRIARRTRLLIESRVKRFTYLRDLVGNKTAGTEKDRERANRLFTRALPVQWIQGSPEMAESSFYKINSQGTALDETEELLIRNRRRPVAISARAILRAGAGHKYWSGFSTENTSKIEQLAEEFHALLFRPEIGQPVKTLDVPLGGSVSPIDALSLLIDFLTIAGSRDAKTKTIEEYATDDTGDATIEVLQNALEIVNRITGNSGGSLGLHPAVYFYNERGKYSRFLFLGMTLLLTERVRSNDKFFFFKFTKARERVEQFLMGNKSLVGILLQNMAKGQRIPRMRDLFMYLIDGYYSDAKVDVQGAIAHLGLRGRIIDVEGLKTSAKFSDDTKSAIFINQALAAALKCPQCNGKLDPGKSISYDHTQRVREGGVGSVENGGLMHPFCNTGVKA